MTKEELIKAMRICANQTCCDNCPRYDIDHTQDAQRCCIQLINDAADAIEAAEKRIAELERNFSDVCNANGSLTCERNELLNDVRELEAQLPKEGEWQWDEAKCMYRCSVCKSPKAREDMDRKIVKEQPFCYNCGARCK